MPRGPAGQQVLAGGVELAVQAGHEVERAGGQDRVAAGDGGAGELYAAFHVIGFPS